MFSRRVPEEVPSVVLFPFGPIVLSLPLIDPSTDGKHQVLSNHGVVQRLLVAGS